MCIRTTNENEYTTTFTIGRNGRGGELEIFKQHPDIPISVAFRSERFRKKKITKIKIEMCDGN